MIWQQAAPGGVARYRYRGVSWMCLFTLLWMVVEMLGRHTSGSVSGLEVVWFRYGTHLLVMFILVGSRSGASLVGTNRLGMQLTRSLLMLGMPVCFLLAASRMSLAGIMSVFWLVPLLVMALAHRLGERVGVRNWAAGALGFAGVQMVLRPDGGMFSWGAMSSLGMALCFGLYLWLTQRLEGETASANLFYTAAGVFVLLTLCAPMFWSWPTAGDALIMAGIGLLGLVALFALDKAVRESGAVVAAVAALSQAVWEVLLPSLLATRWPAASAMCGVALVSGAMLLAVMPSMRASAR